MAFEGVFSDSAADQPSSGQADLRGAADSLLRQTYPDLPRDHPVDWDQLTNRLVRKIQTRATQPREQPAGISIPDADVPYAPPQVHDTDRPYQPTVKTEAVKPEQIPQQPLPQPAESQHPAWQRPGWLSGETLGPEKAISVRPTEAAPALQPQPAAPGTPGTSAPGTMVPFQATQPSPTGAATPLQPLQPGTLSAIAGAPGAGARRALQEAQQTVQAFSGLPPAKTAPTAQPPEAMIPKSLGGLGAAPAPPPEAMAAPPPGGIKPLPPDTSPGAQPMQSWGDIVKHPLDVAIPRMLYQFTHGAADIGAAVAGGAVGGMVGGPVGAAAGAAVGPFTTTLLTELGPYYAEALQETKDQNKAFDQALRKATEDGVISGASFAAFEFKPFAGFVRNLLVQAFAVQPGIAAGGQAAKNVIEGKPAGEGVAETVPGAVIGTALPGALIHGAGALLRDRSAPAPGSTTTGTGTPGTGTGTATGTPPGPTPNTGTGGGGAPGAGTGGRTGTGYSRGDRVPGSADGPGAAPRSGEGWGWWTYGGDNPDGSQGAWTYTPPPGGGPQPGTGGAGAGAGGQPPPGGGGGPGAGGAGTQGGTQGPGQAGGPQPGGARAGTQGPRPNPADVDATWAGISPNARGAMQRIMAEMGYPADDIRYTTLDDAKEIIRLQNILRTYYGDTQWKRPGMSLADLQDAVRQANERATSDGHYGGRADTAHEEPPPRPGAQPGPEASGPQSADSEQTEPPRGGPQPGTGTGTREDPVHPQNADDIARAAAQVDQDHTPAQGEANNVRRGHMVWSGLDVTMEAPPGGVRRGVAPDGTSFETRFPPGTAYGYIRGVPPAADGQAPDVLIGPNPQAPQAYVLDELDPVTRAYRQSKVLAGYDNPQQALAAYLATSSKSREQVGGIRAFTPDEVARLARSGGLARPVTALPSPQRAAETEQSAAAPSSPPRAATTEGGVPGTQGGAAPASMRPQLEAAEIGHPALEPVRDHNTIESALQSQGIDPRNVLPVTIAHAAELAARHGFAPLDAWQLAARRYFIDHGVLSMDDVRRHDGDAAAEALLSTIERPARPAPAQTAGAGAGGADTAPAAAPATNRGGNVEAGQGRTAGGRLPEGAGTETRSPETAEPGATAGGKPASGPVPERSASVGRPAPDTEDHAAVGGSTAPRETAEGAAPNEGAAPAGHEGADAETATPGGREAAKAAEAGLGEADQGHKPRRAGGAEGAGTEADERAQTAEGAGAVRNARKPAVKGPRARDEKTYSLFEYLASKGGLKPHPDLQAILDRKLSTRVRKDRAGRVIGTVKTRVNPFVPGFGPLIRKSGMTLDRAREAAVEAKYILDTGDIHGSEATSTINDLLDLLDRESRGEKQYRVGQEHLADRQPDRDEYLHRLEAHLDSELEAHGIDPPGVASKLRDRVIQMMDREGVADPLEAYERAVMEANDDAIERGNTPERSEPIPGWDVPDDAEPAQGEGGAAAGLWLPDREETGAASHEPGPHHREAATEQKEAVAPPTEEAGAEGKPQLVIPGAEQASPATMAQRGAEAPLRPKVAQKAADEGLFGDESKQTDLEDLARKGEPKLYSAPHQPTHLTGLLQAAEFGAKDSAAGRPPRRDLPANLQVAYDASYRRGAQETSVRERAAELDRIAKLYSTARPTPIQQPWYYSAVERAITSAKQEKASPEQWIAMLRNTPGVKKEELDWLGVEDWLREQKGPVTRQELADFVRANRVDVQEVTKGGERPTTFAVSSAGAPANAPDRMDFSTREEAQAELERRQREFPRGYHNVAELPTTESIPKYEQYTTPGVSNYRELLLTLPRRPAERDASSLNEEEFPSISIETPFKSSHWDEPNVLAHVRFDDRTGPNGERVLHVAEIQSDWHQQGRKRGYASRSLSDRVAQAEDKERAAQEHLVKVISKNTTDEVLARQLETRFLSEAEGVSDRFFGPDGVDDETGYARYLSRWDGETREAVDRYIRAVNNRMDARRAASHPSVPDAPFKTTWPELALKRIIRWVAEHGYDQLSWDTGETQEQRYWGHEAIAESVRRWSEVTKPESIRELGDKVLGREMASLMPLNVMDGGVLAVLKHNQVRQAVVSLLPVDVVDVLSRHHISADQLLDKPDVILGKLAVDERRPVAVGVLSSMRDVAAGLRAELGNLRPGGADKEVLPALKAGQLSPREVAGLLDPQRVFHDRAGGSPEGATTAGTGAKPSSSGMRRPSEREYGSAELADLLNAHAEILHGRAGLLEQGFTPPPGEGQRGFYDKILPAAANKLVKKFGAKVEKSGIASEGPLRGPAADHQDQIPAWSITITPELRRAAVEHGFPLFQSATRGEGEPRRPFPRDFPDVVIQQPANSRVRIKDHPDYLAAKAGDAEAAERVVNDMLDARAMARLTKLIGGRTPLLVPVHAEEASGHNALPSEYANELGDRLGLDVATEIAQFNRPHRTGADAADRMRRRAVFRGSVEPGRDYLLVDDAVTQGGTLAELRSYIEARGGKVIGATTLIGSKSSHILAPRPRTITELRSKLPLLEPWWRQTYGHGFDALTESELRYLGRFDSTDAVRVRLAAGGSPAASGGGEGEAGGEASSESGERDHDGLARTDTSAPAGTVPLKSDKASVDRRQRLEAALNDVLRHILGPDAPRLELPDRIEPQGDYRGWGVVPIGDHGYAGAYTPAQRLAASVIEVALGHPSFERRPEDFANSLLHEVAHAFHDHLATQAEMELFAREMPRMRARARDFRELSNEEAASLDPREVIAIDFERYASERARGGTGAGTHIGLRRFYERILEFLRGVANTLRRAFGYTRPEDVWSDLYEGKMAGRPDLKTGREFASRDEVPAESDGDKLYAAPRPVTGALAKTEVARSFKRFWTSTFQPELVSDRAFEAAPQFARYKSAQAQEKDAIVHETEHEWDYWNRRGDAERLSFLDDMERGVARADPEQAAMAQQWRQALDRNWAEEARWGSRAAFVQDYVPHIWERPDDWRAFAEARTAQVGPTWFQKKRTYEYISEGLAAGLKLKSTNPVDLIVHRLLSGVDMRQRMQLLYKLKDMGLAWEGTQGGQQLVDRGWRAINAPDRRQWVIAPDAQLLWKNAVEAQGLWQAEHLGGSLFRGWMALKNAWVPVKLALSGFHPLHVLHISMNNSLARGWTQAKAGDVMGMAKSIGEGIATIPTLGLPQYFSGRRGQRAWITPRGAQTPEQKAMTDLMNRGGFVPQLSEQMRIAARRQLAEAFQKALRGEAGASDWRKMISASLRRPLEKLQAPIFEHWIPALKTHAYLAEAAAMLKRDPALLANDEDLGIALHAIAKSVDNRFGEMFYGNLFWNRYVKDGAIGSFLSLGWNYGFLREFGGAGMEAVSRPLGITPMFAPSHGRQIARSATNKIPNAILYFGTAALMLGAMSYMLDDEHRFPEGWDFVFPRVGGKNPDGTPRRITSMTYLREIPMLLKHVEARGGNWVMGIADMIWNKMMFAPFVQLWSNRDYYGQAIWNENAPFYQEAWQGARHLFIPDPITYESAKRALETGGTMTKDVPLAMLGFSPAPGYAERSAMQNRIAFLFEEHVAPESRAYEEPGEGEAKRAARSAVLSAKQKGDSTALEAARKQALAAGLTGKQIAAVGRTPSDIYMFSRLPQLYQTGLLRQASDEEFRRYYPHADRSIKRGGEFRDRLNSLYKAEAGASPAPRYSPSVFDRNGIYTPPPAPSPSAPTPRPAPAAPPPASGQVMGKMSPFGAYSQ